MPAIILLLSLFPLLIVGFANIGRTLGWLPETFLTSDALQWVSVFLALVLTYGLSVRVAQLRERATRLQDLLLKDPLTGLLNRNGLFDSGQRQLDRTQDSQAFAAVLWLDLDGLKRINDQFGHAAGDALIQATSARLREAFGPDAVCARLGGDEFAVVLPNLPSPRLAEDLARHALERLRSPYALSGQEFRASGSIGVALYPSHAQTLEELLRLADVAMYRAKASGATPMSCGSRTWRPTCRLRCSSSPALRGLEATPAPTLLGRRSPCAQQGCCRQARPQPHTELPTKIRETTMIRPMREMRRALATCGLLAVLGAAGSLAQAAPAVPPQFVGANVAQGQKYYDNFKCAACHAERMMGSSSAMYTRPDRKVHNPQQLIAFTQMCVTQLNHDLFPEEVKDIAAYLNQTYYKFK